MTENTFGEISSDKRTKQQMTVQFKLSSFVPDSSIRSYVNLLNYSRYRTDIDKLTVTFNSN